MRRLASYIALAAVLGACCAAPASAQTVHTRVIGGSQVSGGNYPFQVSLEISNQFFCGGVILDAQHVATAAHCVTAETRPHTKVSPSAVVVSYGSESLSAQSDVNVSAVDVPNEYTTTVGADLSYDVAVLTLSGGGIPLGPNAQPIPIANASQPKNLGSALVSGWGATSESGNVTNTLRAVRVPLKPDADCVAEYGGTNPTPSNNYYNTARGVCAGGGSQPTGNPDTCQGDSGGPIMADLDPDPAVNEFVLLGFTSFGTGCGRAWPAVYTYAQGTGIFSFLNAHAMPTVATTFDADGDQSTDVPGARSGGTTGGGTGTGTGTTGGGTTGLTAVPVTGVPSNPIATVDTARPTVRLSRFSCTKKRRCTISFKSADTGGRVAKFTAVVARKVRNCSGRGAKRFCRTATRRKVLRVRRSSGGFVATATLTKASYTLTAVAVDGAGNRSKRLSKTLRVR